MFRKETGTLTDRLGMGIDFGNGLFIYTRKCDQVLADAHSDFTDRMDAVVAEQIHGTGDHTGGCILYRKQCIIEHAAVEIIEDVCKIPVAAGFIVTAFKIPHDCDFTEGSVGSLISDSDCHKP